MKKQNMKQTIFTLLCGNPANDLRPFFGAID